MAGSSNRTKKIQIHFLLTIPKFQLIPFFFPLSEQELKENKHIDESTNLRRTKYVFFFHNHIKQKEGVLPGFYQYKIAQWTICPKKPQYTI
jgi:hypothetical protein